MMDVSQPLAGRRLLLVEDEAMVAMMIQDMLEDLGCVVAAVAADVPHGLAYAEDDALALDAAVLDVNLGGEKVFPVAERLTTRRVPFIFSTGYGRNGMGPEFAEVPVLAKPYDMVALSGALRIILDQRTS